MNKTIETEEETFIAFVCISCEVNTSHIDEYYMIHDDLWREVNPAGDGMLCIGCVEQRLGRTLNTYDFPHYPINELGYFLQSDRLVDRLTTF